MKDLRVTLATVGAAGLLAFGAVTAISAVMEAPDFTERDRCEAVTLVVAGQALHAEDGTPGSGLPCNPDHGQRVDVIGGTAEDCDRAGGVWFARVAVCEGVDF